MFFDVIDPADGTLVERVHDAGADEARAAVDAAHAALPGWAATPARERGETLRRAYELMIRDRDRLTRLITRENGKSADDAGAEVAYAAEFFRWFGEEAVRTGGDYGPSPAGGTRAVVTHRPVGVAALVTPWNFPAAMATRKIAPALAAGCPVVLKPAAETPLTAFAVAGLLTEAGVPDGVVNLVAGTDANAIVSTWLGDDRVRKLSFTGSTRVGRLLLAKAAERVMNTSMELGGNAPFVVTEDADLDQAVAGAMIAKFRNGGQACTAANRFYIHTSVVESFVERFGAEVEKLTVRPLISAQAVKDITALVDAEVAAGARISHRAYAPVDGPGFYYPPTVLVDVAPGAAILDREIFGPVAPIVTWRDDAELIKLVNASEFGLAGYVFAGELQRAMRLGEAFELGMVGINRGLVSDPSAPFGGLKQSGLGREGARVGLEEFQETTFMSVDWPSV